MKKLFCYLIIALATLYTAILYGSESFLMLFLVELVLPLCLLISVLLVRRRLNARLVVPIPVVERGQETPVQVELLDTARLSGGKVTVELSARLPMSEEPEKLLLYGRILGGSRRSPGQMKLKAAYRPECVGNIPMEITGVWCSDILGLVRLPIPKAGYQAIKPETLLVLPVFQEVPVIVSRQSRDFVGESEEYAGDRGGDDPSEIFQIRDYQPGDKLRSIHWKLTAKTEDLMVREQSLPLGCPVTFYLDLHRPEQDSIQASHKKKGILHRLSGLFSTEPVFLDHQAKRDSYLQIVSSISHSLVREKCRHYIVWFDVERDDIRRYRIEEEEDVYEMLQRLGAMATYSEVRALPELYRHKYHEAVGITELTLKDDLTLYQNGEKLKKFSYQFEKLEQQLGGQELLV